MAKTTTAADSPGAALVRKRWAKTTAKQRSETMRKVRAAGLRKKDKQR
jgi:hypothetical protein